MKPIILTNIALAGALFFNACGQPSGDSEAKPSAPSAGEVALKTEIPEKNIEGTPVPIKLKNLDGVPKSTPSINVPDGVTNLAKGKTVTSSDDLPIIGSLDLVTDGEKNAGEGYYVELMDGLQWIQIDLEASKEIYGVWLWHFHSQERAYHDVIVQLSDDPEFKSGVETIFNNDFDESAGMSKGKQNPYTESNYGKLISANGKKARYVRLYSAGNTSTDMNHYTEVEVFGK